MIAASENDANQFSEGLEFACRRDHASDEQPVYFRRGHRRFDTKHAGKCDYRQA